MINYIILIKQNKNLNLMRNLYLLIAFICIPVTVLSQPQLKLMSYNILNYESIDTARNPYFRTIISAVQPDILVTVENTSQTGVNIFLHQIMNAVNINYNAGVFIDSTDTDNAIFFDSAKIRFVSNTVIRTDLRTINEFKIIHKPTGDTLRIYACHLKASSGASNESSRAVEVDSLRKFTNLLPAGTAFIVLGDFNIYRSTESAYQKLMQISAGDGNFNDPLTMPGVWNDSNYKPYHTQSTRTRSFGNGATGGLDDRFDMILYSNSIKNDGKIKYIGGSLTAFGNDGHHYNDSINKVPNTAVTQTIANALHYASDHLPVYELFSFTPSVTTINIKEIPEGYYNLTSLKLNKKDTLKVILRNSVFPYSAVDSAVSVIDSLTFSGIFTFSGLYSGRYYIELKNKNCIETWSKSGGENITAGGNYIYDFTSAVSNTYGSNTILKGSRFCLYSGDVNHDGAIDASDISAVDNDSFNSLSGNPVSDLNGDNIVDAEDVSIVDNNAYISVVTVRP